MRYQKRPKPSFKKKFHYQLLLSWCSYSCCACVACCSCSTFTSATWVSYCAHCYPTSTIYPYMFYYTRQCSLCHHWPVRFGVNHSCLPVPWANCPSYSGRGCQVRTFIIRETYSFLGYIFIVNVFLFLDCLVATLALSKSTLKCGSSFYLLEQWHWPSAGLYTAKRNSHGFYRIFWVLLSGIYFKKKAITVHTFVSYNCLLLFCFSVNMIRQVRLPSLKICTLLLVLLFFYDIFFVFITPLFTKVNGPLLIYFSSQFKGSYILIKKCTVA